LDIETPTVGEVGGRVEEGKEDTAGGPGEFVAEGVAGTFGSGKTTTIG
jgi:hypothetical protein